ncbi:MAG TPA: GNAT family N-acetyltransferase [Solirubrobacteraceae bacterium]
MNRTAETALESELLLLRAWHPRDAGALATACGDPEICAFTTVPRRYSQEAAAAWIERQAQRVADGTANVFAIVPRWQEDPIGATWLFDFDTSPSARIGCWLLAAHRHDGFGLEATRLLSRWGLSVLGLRRIRLEFLPDNEASRRVCIGLGAIREGQRERVTSQGSTLVERWLLGRSQLEASRAEPGAR